MAINAHLYHKLLQVLCNLQKEQVTTPQAVRPPKTTPYPLTAVEFNIYGFH